MTQLKLWKFSEDYGRCGDAEGLFIATEEEVDKFLDKRNICFGEVLGKHSEVDVYFEKGKNLYSLNVSTSTVLELLSALDEDVLVVFILFSMLVNKLNVRIVERKETFIVMGCLMQIL